MEILFQSKSMAKEMSDSTVRLRKYGPERARRLALRLDQMRASASLSVFRTVHPRCHPFTADRRGQWSADLDGPYRLVFEIADDPVPMDVHGNVDTAAVRRVRILDVTDRH